MQVRVFARELAALPAARMACLCEPCQLPTSGTQAVRFEASGACIACLRPCLVVIDNGWTRAKLFGMPLT